MSGDNISWFTDDYVAKRLFEMLCRLNNIECSIKWKKNEGVDAVIKKSDGTTLRTELKISRALHHGKSRYDFNFSAFDHDKMDIAILFGVLESTRHEPRHDDEIKKIFGYSNHSIDWDCHNFVDPKILSKIVCFVIPTNSDLWTKSKKFTPSIRFNKGDKFANVRFWSDDSEAFKSHISKCSPETTTE